MNAQVNIPEGYWLDPKGNLVPDANVKEIDKLRDQTVRRIWALAEALHQEMKNFKATSFDDVATFVQISADQYGAKIGGNKGNVQLLSFDGSLKIQRNIAEHIVFDERLQAAKILIDECIQSWSADSNDYLKVLVNDAFQVDKEGKISTGRVLGLRRHSIDDPKWKEAMEAIADSIRVVDSKSYVRFYERDEDG